MLTAVSYIWDNGRELDINNHDTYYVISSGTIYFLFFILNVSLSIIYTFIKPKIPVLNMLHATVAIALVLADIAIEFIYRLSLTFNIIIYEGIMLFYLLVTIVFLFNVIYTLVSHLIKT